MTGQIVFLIVLWAILAGVSAWALRQWLIRQQVLERLSSPLGYSEAEERLRTAARGGMIRSWLFRAGFRSPQAMALFMACMTVCLMLGGGLVSLFYLTGAVAQLELLLIIAPGGVGEVFLPLVWVGPWIAGLLVTSIPMLVVRNARRQRVVKIEQDLPLTLDLLATLAEAGISFDSAVERVLQADPAQRPLSQDLRLFQVDVLAGRNRVDALRNLMWRVHVTWFSIFVSAVMHAEQVGSGLANTLRTQADDLRVRRRERALAMAMAIPVKLLLPLIVCFLPGIMTAALAPILFQIIEVLDSFTQGGFAR